MNHYTKGFAMQLLSLFAPILLSHQSSAQGTHVFSTSEYAVFSEYALNTDPAAVWSTDRSNSPGYFSAIADAAFVGAAQGTSFLIDGYAKYYRGTTATAVSFLFPVGQGMDYRPVTISGNIPDNSSFATAWFAGDPNVVSDPTDGATHNRNIKGPGVVSVLPIGFWDWQTTAGTATGMTLTVSIPDASAQTQTANLILVGWDGSKWINLSGEAGTGPYATNWATGNTEGALLSGNWQPTITALGIGSRSFVLPLKLESFRGSTTGCAVELSWKLLDDEKGATFTVQSTSDGLSWRSLATMKSEEGNSKKEYRYSTVQNEPAGRYRLLLAGKEGQVQYSPVLSLTTGCGHPGSLQVFPNPISTGAGTLKIKVQGSRIEIASLLLQNTAGQVVQKQNFSLQAGYNTLDLETGLLVPGTYLLSVTDEKGNRLYPVKKIIKK